MGKVHGGLSRAGKVKLQTPKVPKQDGKNKPLGRARKRMDYNHKFATGVVQSGNRKVPVPPPDSN